MTMNPEKNESNQSPGGVPGSDNPVSGKAAAPAAGSSTNEANQAAADGTDGSLHPLDPLAATQAELAIAQAKLAEMSDAYLRAKADAQNIQRRAAEDVSKAHKFAVEGFAESLLPVADSLEAGLAIQDATPQQIREGAEATLRQLQAALERNKVKPIAPEPGTKFDPALHQAISMVPADQEANTVVSLLQKGYTIAERTLRPALVTVAAPK